VTNDELSVILRMMRVNWTVQASDDLIKLWSNAIGHVDVTDAYGAIETLINDEQRFDKFPTIAEFNAALRQVRRRQELLNPPPQLEGPIVATRSEAYAAALHGYEAECRKQGKAVDMAYFNSVMRAFLPKA
jgi:hypothetical protein